MKKSSRDHRKAMRKVKSNWKAMFNHSSFQILPSGEKKGSPVVSWEINISPVTLESYDSANSKILGDEFETWEFKKL